MSGFNVNPSSFTSSRNGAVLYAYSGKYSGADVTNTAIDIANTGLDDLLCTAIITIDWVLTQTDAGTTAAIDSIDIWNAQCDIQAGANAVAPFTFTFLVPAQSHLEIKTLMDAAGAGAGAARSVMVYAYPLTII